ncbi:MAG: cell division protein SepF [Oscillospiraceae bacterium]|jgi:cell division inhibitor SepF|nr:cell division protein SepF [Oscillospiraceae bacterium]MDR1329627.1 cell division protein SepF [Oscillospiraceae bacterium]
MSFFSSVVKFMRPYGEDDDLPDYAPPPEPEITVPPRTPAQARTSYGGFDEKRGGSSKVMNIHATAQLQVVLVQPESFDNVTEIAEHLRERRTVVLNLENTGRDVMRRLLDFLSGFAFAQDGNVKKVAVSTYIITPYNVSLMGDLIDELENNGLYF